MEMGAGVGVYSQRFIEQFDDQSDFFAMSELMLRLVLCTSFLAILVPRVVQGEQDIPQAAIDGWREMEVQAKTLQFAVEFSDAIVGIRKTYACSIQGDLKKCEITRVEGNESNKEVQIFNVRGFALGVNSNGKYRLAKIGAPGESLPVLQNLTVVGKFGFSFHGSALLREIPSMPNLRVKYWREPVGEFGYAEMQIRDDSDKTTSTVTLDPKRRYRFISAVHVEDDDPEPAVWINEYSDVSLLTEIVPNKIYLKDYQREWNISSVSSDTLPESQFRLSHYGLPDFVEPKNTVNFWLLLMLISFVITIGVFWKTRSHT